LRTPEQHSHGGADQRRSLLALTGVPSWNPIVRALSHSAGLDLVDNARLFALVNMAATDSFIAVFDAKYAYNFWRRSPRSATATCTATVKSRATPLDAAHRYADASRVSLRALHFFHRGRYRAHFGTSRKADLRHDDEPDGAGVTRKWERIEDYMQEVNDARIYGGVHYRFSTRTGLTWPQDRRARDQGLHETAVAACRYAARVTAGCACVISDRPCFARNKNVVCPGPDHSRHSGARQTPC
jgi:hypothetical protein